MKIRCLLSFIVAAFLGATSPSSAAESSQAKPILSVQLTHVANEGVLITGAREGVLIDAIFSKSFGIFEVPQPEVLEKMKAATQPFDHITCVLATHGDLDHIGIEDTVQHLLKNPEASFFGPQEIVKQMQQVPRFDQIAPRAHAASQDGAFTDQRINAGLTVRAIPLDHLTRPASMPKAPYNVGHLFSVDGIKFLHTGDMGSQNLESLKRARLREEQIDVLIVGFYLFRSPGEEEARAILEYLNPKVVLLTHLTLKGHSQEAERILNMKGLPRIIPLDSLMQSYSVSKDGAELSINKR